jgi:two-component sensor histidine kinase
MIDIRERKHREERQRLLTGELNHRIQNLFAVVQSVALNA